MEFKYEGNSLKSGVYKIVNNQNGRIYIGSAKEFKERWNQHHASLKRGMHSNCFLQADFVKCGSDAFVFEVLEVVDDNKAKRLEIEEIYIKRHFDDGHQCYNLCNRAISREGSSDLGQRTKRKQETKKRPPMSEETKQKLRKINLGKKVSKETKEKMSVAMTGKKTSDETKALLSAIRKGKPAHPNSSRLGAKHTEEAKKKMSLAHRKQKNG